MLIRPAFGVFCPFKFEGTNGLNCKKQFKYKNVFAVNRRQGCTTCITIREQITVQMANCISVGSLLGLFNSRRAELAC